MAKVTYPTREEKTPAKLSQEEKELIVEEILGIHPRFLHAHGTSLTVDVWEFEHQTGRTFRGFPGKLPAESVPKVT